MENSQSSTYSPSRSDQVPPAAARTLLFSRSYATQVQCVGVMYLIVRIAFGTPGRKTASHVPRSCRPGSPVFFFCWSPCFIRVQTSSTLISLSGTALWSHLSPTSLIVNRNVLPRSC